MSWVPAPRYALRRSCVLQLLGSEPGTRFLEVGCGAGDLMVHLARRGFSGVGVELSEQARAEARSRTQRYPGLEIHAELDAVQETAFDLVIACEVLEHIEDDRGALRDWVDRLRPGGKLLLSVPSHKKRWGVSDEWAGHYRRYERAELSEMLTAAGLEVGQLWCYGFPLSNMVKPVRALLSSMSARADQALTREQRTQRSGVERGRLSRLSSLLSHPLPILPFHRLQLVFRHRELGTGYVVLASL